MYSFGEPPKNANMAPKMKAFMAEHDARRAKNG